MALAILHAVAEAREAGRKHEAFEATRADAARFADALVATGGAAPSDQDVRDALDRFAGDGPRLGKLAGVIPAERGTRVLVSFSRPYERGVTLFGPSDTMAVRCFTLDLPETGRGRPRVTAHGPDVSCGTLAAEAPHVRHAYPYAEGSRVNMGKGAA
ncbi:hypothetical protein [Streptomyces sp. NPDC004285]